MTTTQKLWLLISGIALAVLVSWLYNASPVYAAPENLQWQDRTTITSNERDFEHEEDAEQTTFREDTPIWSSGICPDLLRNFSEDLTEASWTNRRQQSGQAGTCTADDPVRVSIGNAETLSNEDREFLGGRVVGDGESSEEEGGDGAGCEAKGLLGFFMCDFIGGVISQIEDIQTSFVELFFETEPLTLDTSSNLYSVWSNVRNIANALLAVAFMAIIFSLAFSVNVDAYTIKRLVPKLLVATIGIQASFLISGLMVDATNVLGAGLSGIFDMAMEGTTFEVDDGDASSKIAVGGRDALLIGAIVGGGVAIWMNAPFIGIILLFGLLIFLGAFLIIAIREVLILACVVLSPVAFLANLLPATERWFKFWWSNFARLLFMYPFIILMIQLGNLGAYLTLETSGSFYALFMALLIQLAALLSVFLAFKLGGSMLSFAASGFNRMGKYGQKKTSQGMKKRKTDKENWQSRMASKPGVMGRAARGYKRAGGVKGPRAVNDLHAAAAERAQTDMERDKLNDRDATQMFFGKKEEDGTIKSGKEVYDAEYSKAVAAGDQPRAEKLERQWRMVKRGGYHKNPAHMKLAAQNAASQGIAPDLVRSTLRNQFGSSAAGAEAFQEYSMNAKKEGHEHAPFIDYNTGQLDRQRFAEKSRDKNAEQLSKFSNDAWSELVGDYDDQGRLKNTPALSQADPDKRVSTETLRSMLGSPATGVQPRVSDNDARKINEYLKRYGGGAPPAPNVQHGPPSPPS